MEQTSDNENQVIGPVVSPIENVDQNGDHEPPEMKAAKELARRYRLPFVDLLPPDRESPIDYQLFTEVPVDLMVRHQFVPLRRDGKGLHIAMADPTDLERLDEVSSTLRTRVIPHVATAGAVEVVLRKGDTTQRVLQEAASGFRISLVRETEHGEEVLDLDRLATDSEMSPIIKLVDTIIYNAMESRASDIHIETRDTEVQVKYRIDGALYQKVDPIDLAYHQTLISRIKVMSELDIAERRVPQDGRFRVRYKGRNVDFRVSIMPTVHGEDAVIRILDKEQINESFKNLDLDVARGLRSILRHDPDKIMVGEIRDEETAQIAIQSALTGHLVFTTVHANNVIDVIGRFLNMGVEPYNFVSSLNCVLAQRLVRILCTICRRPYHPSDTELIESGLQPDEHRNRVFYVNTGCESCNHTGYRGRTAIHELLDLSDNIREMIVERRPGSEVRRAAEAEGLTSLRESALKKIFTGVSTLHEINRVTFVEELNLNTQR